MGFALAAAAEEAGAKVILVSGPVSMATPQGVERIDVETAEEMYASVHERVSEADLFIACAAVSDFKPETEADEKLKRTQKTLNLELIRSPDTLASVAELKDGPFTVGFAAETQNVAENARSKLTRKGLDMIAANQVGRDCGFDQETNSLIVFWDNDEVDLERASKPVLAGRLIHLIAERYRAAHSERDSTQAV